MSESNVLMRDMTPDDWPVVRTIYEEGIASGDATFETAAPAWEEWDVGHLKACRLVAAHAGRVIGWTALSPVSGRCVYGGVAEVSVYVSGAAQGRGIGRTLLQSLIEAYEREGLWSSRQAFSLRTRPAS